MTAFSDTWSAAFQVLPAETEDVRLGAGRIRDLKRAIAERLVVDHSWAGDALDGVHKQLTMPEQAADPTPVAATGFVYTKDVDGGTELFYQDAAGNVIPLTSAGGSGFITGEVRAVAYAALPAGWLTCNGAAVSRTTYAALFALLSTTWGVGDGSTTFNLPDLRGRALIGSGTGSGLTARTVGQQTIGEEAHALTSAENGTHSHGVTDPGHVHPYGYPNWSGTATFGEGTGSSSPANTQSAVTGISIQNSGSGTAHNTMQPSAVVQWIIKI